MSESGLPPIAIPIGGDLSGFESSVNKCLRLMDKMADKSMIVAVTLNETFGRNMESSFSKSVDKMVSRMENGAARMKAALAGVGLTGAGAGAVGMVVPNRPPVPAVPTPAAIPPAAIPAAGATGAALRNGLVESGIAGSIIGGGAVMGLKSGVSAYRDFEGAITESMAITMDATEELRQKARDTSIALSVEMGMGAKDLAQGIYYLVGGLGTGLNPAIEELSVAAKFARAGMMGLSQASELMVDSQHALGMVTGDVNKDFANSTKITDSLAYAAVKYDATLPQMAEGMARGAASGRQMSQSIEDISVVLGEFSNQAIKGEVAGEKYMQLINLLANAYLSKKKVWDQFGMTIFDQSGKALPVPEIIKQFDEVFKGVDDKSKRIAMKQLGIRALLQKPLLMLMGRGEAMISARAEMQKSSAGYTDMVFKKQLESPAVQAAIRQQKAMASMIEIGRKVDGVFATIKNAAVGLLQVVAAIPKPMLQILTIGTGMLAVFGGASMLLRPVHLMLVNMGKIALSLGGLFSKILAPLGALVGLSGGWVIALGAAVAAAAALAGYFMYFGKMPDFITKSVTAMKLIFGFIRSNFGAIGEGVGQLIGALIAGFVTWQAELAIKMGLLFVAVAESWKELFQGLVKYIGIALLSGGIVGIAFRLGGLIMKGVIKGITGAKMEEVLLNAGDALNGILEGKSFAERVKAIGGFTNPFDMDAIKHAFDGVQGGDKLLSELRDLYAVQKKAEEIQPPQPPQLKQEDTIGNKLAESMGKPTGEFAAVARGTADAYKAEMTGRAAFEKELLGETKKQTGILGRIDSGIQKVADALGGGDDMEYAAEDV